MKNNFKQNLSIIDKIKTGNIKTAYTTLPNQTNLLKKFLRISPFHLPYFTILNLPFFILMIIHFLQTCKKNHEDMILLLIVSMGLVYLLPKFWWYYLSIGYVTLPVLPNRSGYTNGRRAWLNLTAINQRSESWSAFCGVTVSWL